MRSFLSDLQATNPGAITSAVFFDDNPALVRCINENAKDFKLFPLIAKDLNSESACKYIGANHQQIGCCIHTDVDELVDTGNAVVLSCLFVYDLPLRYAACADDLQKIINGMFYMLRPNSAGFMFFNHKKCVDFAG